MTERDYISMIPTEIWQLILQHSVPPVPDFLDPEYMVDRWPPWIISNRKSSESTAYDNAEAIRNTLRRVCKSWDEYLRQYAHQFVCMLDVVHGKVPPHYLRSAVRIWFGGHDGVWCTTCSSQQSRREEEVKGYFEHCRHILEIYKPFKAQILDYGLYGYNMLKQLVSENSFPNLVRIEAIDSPLPADETLQIIESSPSLHHIYARLKWEEDRVLSLRSSTLTTLLISFRIPNTSFTLFKDESLQIPALRHLHIHYSFYDHPVTYPEPASLALVRIVGKELKTLSLPREELCTGIVTGEIWSICPKLEDLYFPWYPPTAPPVGHPIHTLGTCYYWVTRRDDLEDYIPDWPGLRTVRIDMSWQLWEGYGYGPLTAPQLNWLSSRGIGLEDCRGEPYPKDMPGFKLEENEP
jgi:hypothetical protein